MTDTTILPQRTVDDYKSDEHPIWCPGCGDFGVLNAVYVALKAKNFQPEDVVAVSGIGCSSRLPYFMSTYGFHSLHGRAMPIATGVKVANPDLKVLAVGGDGDAYAIGAGHTVHAIRRNTDICYVIMDNAVYGLTKGQTSPTSAIGFTTKTTPRGSADSPINPLLLALAAGATFVARGFSGKPKELAELIVRGIEHKGFAFIDTYSPCPTFNKINTFKFYREQVADIPADHDVTNKVEALRYAASEDPLYLGVFFQIEAPSLLEHIQAQTSGTEADIPRVVNSLFSKYS
jgi:2-oxoglutarate ferredoxin oxidoreductase subunit beta